MTTDGYKIQLSGGTVEFYTDPWSGKANGSRNSGTYQVIYETGEWLVVQINESTPGSSFIRKVDVGLYSQGSYVYQERWLGGEGYVTAPGGQGDRWMVMFDSDGVSVGIRVQPDLDTEMLAIIHSGDVITVLNNMLEISK